uniref:ENT domain-containing protein n=4 Tax=Kalanchoe fedtschenkoi TaxID=63787 RepID=A0A7N0U8K0_KALFE
MKFKKGTKVEVFSDTGGPSGSWMCGEIVNGNGRYYTVKYHPYASKKSEGVLCRVARDCMRPCPPVLDVTSWASRDIVEELKAHNCDIRPRLVWQDEKWVLTGKDCRLMHLNSGRGDDAGDNIVVVKYKKDTTHSCIVSSRTLKRAFPYGSSFIGNAQKKLKISTDGKHKQLTHTQQAEKVGVVAYPPQICGDRYLQSSFNVGTPAYHNLQKEAPNPFECSLARSHQLDEISVASSVGSCSFSGGRDNELQYPDTTALSSDADSLCLRGEDRDELFNLSPDEMLAGELYRLELHAYRKMLEAFHASGAISWEKEELLTDLRISLHISDDDHLLELKRLSSRPMMQQIS